MTSGHASPVRRVSRVRWVPPFLVGAAAAVVAEVSVSLLLYGGPGFVRGLTTILTVECVALATGLLTAPAPGPKLVDRLRRRWVACLTSFLLAGTYGTLWSLNVIGQGRLPQGAGLALVAALPLYTVGTVLGGIATEAAHAEGRGRTAGIAVSGAAFGVVATGYLLPRAPMPASLLVGCLVVLSLAGMVYGVVLRSRVEVKRLTTRPSPAGEIRLEEWREADRAGADLLLFEGSTERRRYPVEERTAPPWDVALLRAVLPDLERPFRVLAVGMGASSAPGALLREHPSATVTVLERIPVLVEVAREHFGTGLVIGQHDRQHVMTGNLDDRIDELTTGADVILVDSRALNPVGGVRGLSKASWATLRRLAAPSGVLVLGPELPEAETSFEAEGWLRAEYRRASDREGVRDESILVTTSPQPGIEWPEDFDGFRLVGAATSV